jgi:hypothetical protein
MWELRVKYFQVFRRILLVMRYNYVIKQKSLDAYENDQTFNLLLDELHIYRLSRDFPWSFLKMTRRRLQLFTVEVHSSNLHN